MTSTARAQGGNRLRLFRPIAALWTVLAAAAPAPAADASTTFRIVPGHAARQELCFNVGTAGAVRIVVNPDDGTDRLHVTLYAGQEPVQSVQGQGRLELAATVTPEQLAQGREWAVFVTGASRESRATGRIDVTFPEPADAPRHAVDAWLRQHPAVAYHLVWNEAGRPLPYSVWPPAMGPRLWALVDLARAGRPAAQPDPPPNAWQDQPGDDPTAIHTSFSPDVARELYLATVSHALWLEIDRRVPWSLDDLDGDELEALLASASLFWWNPSQQGYEISEFDHGWAVPPAPSTAWRFLRDEQVLGDTRLQTITRLIGWSGRLVHFAGPVSRQNFRDHWGYDGDMPVARALSGTRYGGTAFQSMPGYEGERHYTAGCQGTAGLMVGVLRAANIPARLRSVTNDSFTHATLLLLSEDRALSHGDDPYSPLAEGADPNDLLLDLATYDRWLGPTSKDPGRNIGRQAAALGLASLPPVVRRAFEMDRERGAEPAQSAVFALFRDTHTLDEVNDARLWERLGGSGAAVDARPSADDAWIEAETVDATVTAGAVEVQPMEGFTASTWRQGRQLLWRDGRPGSALTLPFTVPEAGTYQVSLRFTRAPDYATVTIRLAGQNDLLDRVSLYAPFVLAADPLPVGEHTLGAGRHALTFTIVGAHPQAVPDFKVGIDALRIQRVR